MKDKFQSLKGEQFNKKIAVTEKDPHIHPLAYEIEKRPEVFRVESFQTKKKVRLLITFDGWGVPLGFFDDYDIEPEEFYIVNPHSALKQILWPTDPKLEVSATIDSPPLEFEDG